MSLIQTQLVTAEEYYHLPDDVTEHTELVRGVIKSIRGESMPAGHTHGDIAALILYYILDFVLKNNLGKVYTAETGFVIRQNPDSVRAPDAAFVSKDRLPRENSAGFFIGAPDLAVEVISPSETFEQVDSKIDEYLSSGVNEVWIVRPGTRTVTVYKSPQHIETFSDQNTLNNSDVLKGFSLEIGKLFQ